MLGFLLFTAVVIARVNDLLVVVVLRGIYSMLCASVFIVMHAVDVALTEVVVGAGISTLLMLEALTLIRRETRPSPRIRVLPLAAVVLCGGLLIHGVADLPAFGSPSAPGHQHVSNYYVQNTLAETGVVNVVTSVLASYRGYDTLGELVVIFTACIGVTGLLVRSSPAGKPVQEPVREPVADVSRQASMEQHSILRIVVKMLIPLILLFGLYVQFHGDYGPGGGFQAGIIFASAIILYGMMFGSARMKQVMNLEVVQMLAATGVLIFGSVGLVSLLRGKNFLDYSALLPEAAAGQHMGILLIELGVGITVAAVMIIVFHAFTDYVNRELDSP